MNAQKRREMFNDGTWSFEKNEQGAHFIVCKHHGHFSASKTTVGKDGRGTTIRDESATCPECDSFCDSCSRPRDYRRCSLNSGRYKTSKSEFCECV